MTNLWDSTCFKLYEFDNYSDILSVYCEQAEYFDKLLKL